MRCYMDRVHVQLAGTDYVIVPRAEFDRLSSLAKVSDLPPLPAPDKDGNVDAIEYSRASLARKLIRERIRAGLSQKQLAARAGIREETLCRLETGKHTASVATVDKISRALKTRRKAVRRQ